MRREDKWIAGIKEVLLQLFVLIFIGGIFVLIPNRHKLKGFSMPGLTFVQEWTKGAK